MLPSSTLPNRLRRSLRGIAVVGMVVAGEGCGSSESLAPADIAAGGSRLAVATGEGDQRIQRVDLDFTFPLNCGDETLDVHVVGFFQYRILERGSSRNVEVFMINILATYTNSAGETFVWREVGIDHFTIDDDGNLVRAVIGRAGVEFGTIGRIVVDLATGEVEFIAGQDVGRTEVNACAALT